MAINKCTRLSVLSVVTLFAGCTAEPILPPAKVFAVQPPPDTWVLDGDTSHLSFVSIKAGDIAEIHYFDRLSGSLEKSGVLDVTIELDSVNTSISIRDERMREFLFKTDQFPTATISAQIDMTPLSALNEGRDISLQVDAILSLNDTELEIPSLVTVARLSGNKMLVSSARPIIVNADAVNFAAGLEKLRELAGLPSISKAVPVTFVLTFTGQ